MSRSYRPRSRRRLTKDTLRRGQMIRHVGSGQIAKVAGIGREPPIFTHEDKRVTVLVRGGKRRLRNWTTTKLEYV